MVFKILGYRTLSLGIIIRVLKMYVLYNKNLNQVICYKFYRKRKTISHKGNNFPSKYDREL